MNIENVIAGFLRVAAEDLQGARALAEIPNRNAIYLCSQAAEKLIRAVLTARIQKYFMSRQAARQDVWKGRLAPPSEAQLFDVADDSLDEWISLYP